MRKRFKSVSRNAKTFVLIWFIGILLPAGHARAANEFVTVPVILGDYYAWAYTEAFEDRANAYGWTTAGVDALGWSLVLAAQSEAGLKLVNLAGIAKTVYPVTAILWASDEAVRQRAWIALGTHALSLVTLELLGRPFDDAKLVSYAYAYEQATHHRRAPARTPALHGASSIPVMNWESSVEAPGNKSKVSAKFSFDPATNELTYNVTAAGFRDDEILAATIHRAEKGGNGPAIAVLSNHAFQTIGGSETLSDPDREKLMSGGLYLRITSRSAGTNNMRISLQPVP